jgi:acetyl-CoA carboxylase carboxyltransferase component
MEHPFSILPTRVDPRAAQFVSNREANLASLERLRAALEKVNQGGGPKYNDRFAAQEKLLPRERIELLLDRDAPFLELCALAGHGVRGASAGGGVVGGVGVVSGVECLITASEATVKGGAVDETGLLKSRRLAEVAADNGLPCVNLIESAGADLPNQHKIFVPGGEGFREITRRSKAGLPTVTLVFGSSTAGGAYIPGMSDYTVMVRQQAQVYLAGPPLVKMATGEDTDHEELGGAEMHSRVSGVSDYLAQDERDALRLGRQIIAQLNWRKQGPAPLAPVEPPRYDPEELLGIASADLKVPFDAREVIARLVDGSRFAEFKALYGPTLVCGWARLHGYPVGILANNGVLFTDSANKGAQFIQLCNQSRTPLIFLQNITGFMVGRRYEQEGIIKAGAKLINAVSNSEVPALTVMIGASFGAGNYAMCGRAYEPRFLFSWPNHRIAVMGGKQLGGVLEIIKRQAAEKADAPVNEAELAGMKMMIEAQIEQESDPFFATARLWDDGIQDPRQTRDALGICLSATHTRAVTGANAWGVFRH